jgi:hypothetical protein
MFPHRRVFILSYAAPVSCDAPLHQTKGFRREVTDADVEVEEDEDDDMEDERASEDGWEVMGR